MDLALLGVVGCWGGLLVDGSGLANRWGWQLTDFTSASVNLDEIEPAGPARDAIPAIDSPHWVNSEQADPWLHPNEPVVVVHLAQQARAYPLQILLWHAIVNDRIGGLPVTVTYSALCNSPAVFDRRLQGQVLDFGSTGQVRRSNLIMYDRQTHSWWQQLSGEGVVGAHAGRVLAQIPYSVVPYQSFRRTYPRGRILSRQTGYRRPYGTSPYQGYERIREPPFSFERGFDRRLPPLERVLRVTVRGQDVLYPHSVLERMPLINDVVAGEPIVVLSRPGTLSVLDQKNIRESRRIRSANAFSSVVTGITLRFARYDGRTIDLQTGSEWNLLGRAVNGRLRGHQLEPVVRGVHFSFAWLAFEPHSYVYEPPAWAQLPAR
ncbi:MAG: DUF3179 domain-containing protein [Proteobacteria bacterium]|nr:DUF3179 domain-containing protein [Pseudomonadota bacterium]